MSKENCRKPHVLTPWLRQKSEHCDRVCSAGSLELDAIIHQIHFVDEHISHPLVNMNLLDGLVRFTSIFKHKLICFAHMRCWELVGKSQIQDRAYGIWDLALLEMGSPVKRRKLGLEMLMPACQTNLGLR
jgi:hypothetical protein